MGAQALIWAGESQGVIRVDDWPNPPAVFKTITLHTLDFSGSITIQASLSENPTEDEWFTIAVETFTKPGVFADKIQNRVINSRDRYVVMRATIATLHGRVDRVMVSC